MQCGYCAEKPGSYAVVIQSEVSYNSASRAVAVAPKVRLRDLRKRFYVRGRAVQALAEIDLDIRPGEFFCIVGPSGCGKTTLLRILAGLERQTDGSVAVARDHIQEPAAYKRPLNALVFQEDSIFPWMTVLDNVSFGLKARGLSRSKRYSVAEPFIRKVGLGGFEDALPHQLSGGMRQRVSIARAFATDPEMLLMDEPFAALDEQTRLIMQAELLRIWEETRKTVLYVTHSIDEAIVLGDRILVMSARPGRIKDVVDVNTVFGRPRFVEQVKSSEQYGGLFGRVWGQLRNEVVTAQPANEEDVRPMSSSTPAETVPQGSLVEVGSPEATASAPRAAIMAVDPASSVLSPVLLLLLWEVLARVGVIDIRFFPAPSNIFATLGEMIRAGELWTHVSASLQRIGIGFLIGAVPGVIVGLAMGLFSPIRAVIQPLVDSTFPIPKIAVLPLFILIFGIGEESKYAIIATAVIYLVLINTAAGVKNIDRIYLDVGENFHARRLMMFTDVALPGALPMIAAGLKLGMGVALLVIVAAEFVGAKSGLGYLIWTSWQVFQVEKMYVGLLVIAVVGFASAILLNYLERWLIPWKHTR